MKAYAGIDLHSRNNYLAVIDEQDKRLFGKRLPNDLNITLTALEPFRKNLTGVVIESTYNWYWLVDGLVDNGYTVHLANPSAIKQYEGLKHTDDPWDAYWLAHMLRLGILPKGYIYPKDQRPARDLARRRLLFMRQRTAQVLSLQSMITRHLGVNMSGSAIKALTGDQAAELFDTKYQVMMAQNSIATIRFLSGIISDIEKELLGSIKLCQEFQRLKSIPGIGDILALTIMLEVGDIERFPKVGNYSSYCRCVDSKKLSNKKKKGENNRRNGNKYLGWAYVEAANFAIRFCEEAQRFYQKKKAKRNGVVAIKALSNKLAKASYYIMRDNKSFEVERLFDN